MECHDRKENEGLSVGGSRKRQEIIHLKILVPSIAVGAIIGKGGGSIVKIQKETGARIKLSKVNDFYPGTEERVCLIQGTLEGVTRMHNYIMDRVLEKPEFFESTAISSPNMTATSGSVSGGVAVDSHSSSNVNVSHDVGGGQYPSSPSSTTLPSSVGGWSMAGELSGHRLPWGRHKQVKILVPNCTAGLVIGKLGSYVREIKDRTGAFLQISQKSVEVNLLERCITIAGEPDQCRAAVDLVLAKIAEDPQSGIYPTISYSHVRGPVASAYPSGSPYALMPTVRFPSWFTPHFHLPSGSTSHPVGALSSPIIGPSSGPTGARPTAIPVGSWDNNQLPTTIGFPSYGSAMFPTAFLHPSALASNLNYPTAPLNMASSDMLGATHMSYSATGTDAMLRAASACRPEHDYAAVSTPSSASSSASAAAPLLPDASSLLTDHGVGDVDSSVVGVGVGGGGLTTSTSVPGPSWIAPDSHMNQATGYDSSYVPSLNYAFYPTNQSLLNSSLTTPRQHPIDSYPTHQDLYNNPTNPYASMIGVGMTNLPTNPFHQIPFTNNPTISEQPDDSLTCSFNTDPTALHLASIYPSPTSQLTNTHLVGSPTTVTALNPPSAASQLHQPQHQVAVASLNELFNLLRLGGTGATGGSGELVTDMNHPISPFFGHQSNVMMNAHSQYPANTSYPLVSVSAMEITNMAVAITSTVTSNTTVIMTSTSPIISTTQISTQSALYSSSSSKLSRSSVDGVGGVTAAAASNDYDHHDDNQGADNSISTNNNASENSSAQLEHLNVDATNNGNRGNKLYSSTSVSNRKTAHIAVTTTNVCLTVNYYDKPTDLIQQDKVTCGDIQDINVTQQIGHLNNGSDNSNNRLTPTHKRQHSMQNGQNKAISYLANIGSGKTTTTTPS